MQVEETLKLNVDSYYEEIRAAASVLLFLGRNYAWPVEDLDRHLALAADRLEESAVPLTSRSPQSWLRKYAGTPKSHQFARYTVPASDAEEVVAVLEMKPSMDSEC